MLIFTRREFRAEQQYCHLLSSPAINFSVLYSVVGNIGTEAGEGTAGSTNAAAANVHV